MDYSNFYSFSIALLKVIPRWCCFHQMYDSIGYVAGSMLFPSLLDFFSLINKDTKISKKKIDGHREACIIFCHLLIGFSFVKESIAAWNNFSLQKSFIGGTLLTAKKFIFLEWKLYHKSHESQPEVKSEPDHLPLYETKPKSTHHWIWNYIGLLGELLYMIVFCCMEYQDSWIKTISHVLHLSS